ncbi:histidinol-phosphate transaminase [Thermosulfuriphilus sp.]
MVVLTQTMEAKSYLKEIHPYKPGKPIEELRRELGIRGPIVKLASNENPLGPSPKALEAIVREAPNVHRYPDGAAFELREAFKEVLKVSPREIVLGNGSNEIIDFLIRAFVSEDDEVVTSRPTFLMYERFTRVAGGRTISVPLKNLKHDLGAIAKAVTSRTRIIFLDNPNNPTGTAIRVGELLAFLSDLPLNILVVLDEAYFEFVRDKEVVSGISLFREDKRIIVLRTFSKAYGLAGLRIGYGVMDPEIAAVLERIRQPFNVNLLAQIAARASLVDRDYLAQVQKTIWEGMDFLERELTSLGLLPYPSQTNFILVDLRRPARPVYEALLRRGIIVRPMDSYSFETCIRITVGLPEENQRLIDELKEVLQP